MICLYLKISKKFVHLLLHVRFWFVHIIIIIIASFSYQHLLGVFHWSLNDSKSLQVSKNFIIIILVLTSFSRQRLLVIFLRDSKPSEVSRTLLNILANLNNVVVWTVSILSLISNYFSLFFHSLRIVSSAHSTIGITVIFMFHIIIIILLLASGSPSSFSCV